MATRPLTRCEIAVDADGPVGLVLTRQELPVLEGTAELASDGVSRGAYVLVEEDGAGRAGRDPGWNWQ